MSETSAALPQLAVIVWQSPDGRVSITRRDVFLVLIDGWLSCESETLEQAETFAVAASR